MEQRTEQISFQIENLYKLSPENAAAYIVNTVSKLNESQQSIEEYRQKSFIEKTFSSKDKFYLSLHSDHNKRFFEVLCLIQVLSQTQDINLKYMEKLKEYIIKINSKLKQQSKHVEELNSIVQIIDQNINSKKGNYDNQSAAAKTLKKINNKLRWQILGSILMAWYGIDMILVSLSIKPLGSYESIESTSAMVGFSVIICAILIYRIMKNLTRKKILLQNIKDSSHFCPVCNKLININHRYCKCGFIFENSTDNFAYND